MSRRRNQRGNGGAFWLVGGLAAVGGITFWLFRKGDGDILAGRQFGKELMIALDGINEPRLSKNSVKYALMLTLCVPDKLVFQG